LESASETAATPARYVIFSLFGRLLPFSIFFALVLIHLQLFRVELNGLANASTGLDSVIYVTDRVMGMAFASFVALIYIFRQPPRGARHDPVAIVVSMYASFIPLGVRPIGALIESTDIQIGNSVELLVANLLVGTGLAISMYALFYLKLNFSIMPEARGLTTAGPYALVRHPVYTGEIMSLLGILAAVPNIVGVLILLSFIAAQWVRAGWEEKTLTHAFPDYAAYAARTTKRLIPWVI
jgi:protein-S-isoprenylcysteine O-methyltransferase Ste14